MEDFRFGRELRLLTPSHYSRIFNEPARAATSLFTLLAKPNSLDHARLGLTVAKKNVKQANQRNRIKRIARESFRLHQHKLENIDIVLMVKRGIDELSNEEIRKDLDKLWRKINERCKPGYKPPPRRPHKKHHNTKQKRGQS
ncbi:ribonuclease P protein component [Pseudoalteromonas sp. YIC-827]|uniref:Ribonuclease P protein component n=1 Tax=Pseudoalteromonas qingdaonensis TaxID=3131913 RepID=A0ABU9MWR0_9GAMM